MYSVSAALSGAGEYPYTLGIGSTKERSRVIVATSLAIAKDLATIAGHGIRATIWKLARDGEEGTVKPTLSEFYQAHRYHHDSDQRTALP